MHPLAFVVDVGQGSCNIVRLGKSPNDGGNRAVVIDCGPKTPEIQVQILTESQVTWIDALIVTHNDRDHHGGLTKILGAYRNRIGRIFYAGDRDPNSNEAFAVIKEFYDNKWLVNEPVQIALMDADYRIFPAAYPDDAKLQDVTSPQVFAIAPTGFASYSAAAASDPNRASAVIVLRFENTRIIFPGDATIESWRLLHKRRKMPLQANVIVVPHHGGLIHDAGDAEGLKWLYTEACQCEYAVVSAGTNNRQGRNNAANDHPRTDVMEAIYEAGLTVIRTEKTANCTCCDRNEIARSRQSRRPPQPSFAEHDRHKVACAGTIRIDVLPDDVRFLDYPQIHDSKWRQSQRTCCPLHG